jgi:ATP-dependent Lhr-like helicase
MLTFPRQLELDGIDTYITSAELIPTLKRAIRHTELFKQRFRHCAARAFMILKNYKGREISIRKQHRRSRIVLDAVEHLEDFPVVDESYNEILHDAMDIDNALTVIKGIEKGAIKVSYAPYSHVPSPFAHNVVVVGMSDVILMEDRSALLRELHKQVLSRVFHPETIGEKPQFELRELEQYFMKKRIKVTTKNQILDVLAYFGGMQLFTTKGENIYRYTDCARTTVAGWCRELVDEGKVTSIARGSDVIWIRTDELPTYLTIYGYQGNLDELTDNETNVLELIRKRELPERRRGKSITETLKKLERKNIIYRKSISADNKINWAVRAFPAPTGLKLTDALDTIIIRHLKVYGPSTVQELGYDLAIDEDQIQNRLLELIDAKKVCSGYFALGKELPQYMLLEDIRELERKSKMRTADAVRKASPDKIIFTLDTLKQWSAMHDFTGFNTIDDYFDRYGFVVSLLELYNRLDNFELDTWLEQVRAGDIVLGRFVNGTLCYVRRKDMATYMNAYRVERLEPIDKLVLAVIEAVPGISKSDLIGLFCKKRTPAMSCAPAVLSQLADMPKLKSSYITKAIDKLEHNLYIVRVAEGTMQERGGVRYISTRIISEPKLSVRADAIKAILRKFMGAHAPISINMIEYHLGLSATTVKNYLRGLKRRGEIVECKLGSVSLLLTKELNSKLANAISTGSVAEKFVGDKVRILTLTDPYSRRYINEIRANFGDGNYLVILYGHQFIGMLELQDARESIDIFNMLLEPKIIDLEKPSALELNIFNNILKELDRIVTLYNELDGIEIIRLRSIAGVQIDQVHPKYVKLLRAFGYVKVQNYYVKGKIEPHVYELPDILAYVFHRQHIHPDSKFDTVLDAIKTLGGVKTDYEVLLRVKSKFYGLKSIARSYDLVAGTMIPHGYMYCTEEDWLIYHRAKNRKLDDAMRYVLSRMPENRPIAAQKLRDRVDMSKREFEHVWRKLCDGLFVVRESSNRYLKLDAYGNIDTYASDISSTAGTSIEVQEARYAVVKRLINNFGVISLDALYRFLHHDFKLDVIREILRALEADGKLVKGYFINGDDTLYWMTIDSINKIGKYKFHDYQFVLSPQDPLAIYLSDMLHAKFGIRSGYYVVFDGTDMLCAFKAKKEKDKFVLVELLRGETREEASRLNLKRILDIIYNFAYEHKLKLKFHDTLQLPELQELKEEMGYIYESDDYENVDIDYYEDIL